MIPEPAWVTFILYFITDESKHFGLSAFMGYAVFSLTLTMLSAMVLVWQGLTHKMASMGVVYGILICSIVAGFSAVPLSHWALDYFYTWWVTPLGEGLDLIMP